VREGLTPVLAGLSHLIKYRPRPGQGAVSLNEARKFAAAELAQLLATCFA
jgi:hypothetical protein